MTTTERRINMAKGEEKLAAQVRERFGVSVPTWRMTGKRKDYTRVYSKAEKAEMKALVDWLCGDDEYKALFDVYFGYCAILAARGFAKRDMELAVRPADWKARIRRNFAECQVRYVYYEMCCDPATVLGKGSADGYWIYLDREWQDISHMKVGKAILNLDEVWAVVDHTLGDWIDTGLSREKQFKDSYEVTCDRCGNGISGYKKADSRFDVFENLLHCPECVKTCARHWQGLDALYGKGACNGR